MLKLFPNISIHWNKFTSSKHHSRTDWAILLTKLHIYLDLTSFSPDIVFLSQYLIQHTVLHLNFIYIEYVEIKLCCSIKKFFDIYIYQTMKIDTHVYSPGLPPESTGKIELHLVYFEILQYLNFLQYKQQNSIDGNRISRTPHLFFFFFTHTKKAVLSFVRKGY